MGSTGGDWPTERSVAREVNAPGPRFGRRQFRRLRPMLRNRLRAVVPDYLSLRLVLASLLISSVLSFLATGIQVYSSYTRQKADVLNVFERVERLMQRQLEQALWEFDFDQVDIILDGLMAQSEVSHLSLVSPTGHRWERGEPIAGADNSGSFKLTAVGSDGKRVPVGRLTAQLSFETVNARVWIQFWTVLISNVVKAYLGAVLMLVLVHHMVIRHLRKVAKFASGAQPEEPALRLRLDREPPRHPDVLDQIVQAIRSFETRVEGYVQQLNQEIEKRDAAQISARRAEQMRNQFLANVGQDVQPSLKSIRGLFQLISEDESLPNKPRGQAKLGQHAAYAMVSQLNNILDLSRLDSDDFTPLVSVSELEPLVQSWKNHAQLLVDAQGATERPDIRVLVEQDPRLAAAYWLDRQCVTRVVECLLDNAVKFSSLSGAKGAQVAILLRSLEDKALQDDGCNNGLEVLVRDSGPVIAYGDRDRVFERFARVEDHLPHRVDGAGLGLAVALEITRQMGGTLRVAACEVAGFGNEFRLTLPDLRPVTDRSTPV